MIEMQSNGKTMRLGAMTASAILLILAVCIVPVSAVDDVFMDNNKTYAPVANDAGARFDIFWNDTYYFNFSKPSTSLICDTPTVPLHPKTRTKAKDLYGLQASPHAFHPREEDNLQ